MARGQKNPKRKISEVVYKYLETNSGKFERVVEGEERTQKRGKSNRKYERGKRKEERC